MLKKIFTKSLKWLVYIVLGIVSLVILILIAFYIPPVQDFIFKKATTILNNGDLLHISYDKLRIEFPTHLKGENIEVDLPGEMDASLGYIDANLNLIPLLGLNISTEEINLRDANFSLGNPDSSIYLKAKIDTFDVNDLSVKVKEATVDFTKGDIAGVNVSLIINETDDEKTIKEDPKSTTDKQFVIKAHELTMKRLDYFMSIENTIDTLDTFIPQLELNKAVVDLNNNSVRVNSFDVDDIIAKYIYSFGDKKSSEIKDSIPADSIQTIDTDPWKIEVNSINLTAKEALYARAGLKSINYFSPEYIKARDIDIEIDSFYNCAQDIRVPIKSLRVGDILGLTLGAKGRFSIDNNMMSISDFNINMPGSTIEVEANMGLLSDRYPDAASTPVSLKMKADIAPGDLSVFVPDMNYLIKAMPSATPILADVDIQGSMDNLDISALSISLPRYLNLSASGFVAGFNETEPLKNLSSNLTLQGQLVNSNVLKPSVVEAKLGKQLHLSPFKISGNARFYKGSGDARLNLKVSEGSANLNGKINFNSEGYDIKFDTRQFPLQNFMPQLGISDITASVNAKGLKFDPLNKKASLEAQLNLDTVNLHNKLFRDIQLNLNLNQGDASVLISSDMSALDFTIRANGNLDLHNLLWTLNGDIRNLNLQDLGLSDTYNGGNLRVDGNFEMNVDSMFVHADINLPSLTWKIDDRSVSTNKLNITFDADKQGTVFDIEDRDLLFEMSSSESLDSIMKRFGSLSGVIDSCLRNTYLDVDLIQETLPPFNAVFTANRKNIISSWLATRGEYFDSIGISIANSKTLKLKGIIRNYNTPKYIVDSITADIRQQNDSLIYKFHLLNSPMSPGDWANVILFGRLGGNELDVRFNQKNHEGNTGFLLGLDASIADSTVVVKFKPTHPIIAYKDWSINENNFISIDLASMHMDANLLMQHNQSSLKLYTEHKDDTVDQEAINLQLSNIEIGDWMSLNPFATPMKGILNGNIELSHEGKIYSGDGTIKLADFIYGKQRVGDFELVLDVSTTPHGFIHASADVAIDSVKVLDIYGVLNDTTVSQPFMLELNIDSLPLKIINPFLYDAGIQLSGYLDGEMTVTGTPSKPVFNGFIDFQNTGVKVVLLGTTYILSEKKIPVDTGIVRFNSYDIKGVNDNPLIIDGTVNMRDVFNPSINLSLTAENTQIVGSDRARGGAEVYGKAFIDLNADVKGDLSYLNVNAKAAILNTTNVTYVMIGGGQNSLSSKSNSDLVKFVNFADTSMMASADSLQLKGTLMSVSALLSIDRGAIISVDLSADGKNKVQIEPYGDLDYSMDILGAQHMTGRINIESGFARYTPPLMSEKLFNLQDGSYVDFNGNISNPLLNIHAVDRLRANVTQEGQNSRLIYFNVMLDVTGSLENMNIGFNLSTNDDLTVENELESMSPSQRASKAMNLLLTNMYTGPGTTADANMGANALYSFLGSTLNSWAANNIKAVDLSFGINQYDNTTDGVTTQATSYSYNVSKSLFDDRFKINIGGNYTTDANADENIAQNLISDISIEYVLNPNGSMNIKIFRHAGFESILEGEVIQTGIGFTYRKRLNSLRQMLWFLLPKEYRYNSMEDKELEKYKKKIEKKETELREEEN